MNKITQHKPIAKSHAKIVLTGNCNIKGNIPFEVYRQAVKYNITGYIKFRKEDKSEIVVEAERKAVEFFINWLISFVKDQGIQFNLHWSDSILNYKEFRIIHQKYENSIKAIK